MTPPASSPRSTWRVRILPSNLAVMLFLKGSSFRGWTGSKFVKDFAGLDGHLPEVALAIGHAVEGAPVHLPGAPDDLDKETDPMRVALAGVDRPDSLTEFGMAQGASLWTSRAGTGAVETNCGTVARWRGTSQVVFPDRLPTLLAHAFGVGRSPVVDAGFHEFNRIGDQWNLLLRLDSLIRAVECQSLG